MIYYFGKTGNVKQRDGRAFVEGEFSFKVFEDENERDAWTEDWDKNFSQNRWVASERDIEQAFGKKLAKDIKRVGYFNCLDKRGMLVKFHATKVVCEFDYKKSLEAQGLSSEDIEDIMKEKQINRAAKLLSHQSARIR